MNARERLLAMYYFWDFSWQRWETMQATDLSRPPKAIAEEWKLTLFPGKAAPDSWQQALTKASAHSFATITPLDSHYPSGLHRLSRVPPVLYLKGSGLSSLLGTVTIVGTRKCSHLGEESSYRLAFELGSVGLGIASGLALGVDAAAHQGAVDAKAFTIAVLGSCLEPLYPRENQYLADQIVEHGGSLVSEFPPGTELQKYFFPRRNAILATLGAGVVVVEAPMRSGAQITAKIALGSGCPVAVLPWNFNEAKGEGAAYLLRNGAWPTLSTEDIIEHLRFGNCGQTLLSADGRDLLPKIFSLEQFCSSGRDPFLHKVRRLQQLLKAGIILELSPDRYQLRCFRSAQNHSE